MYVFKDHLGERSHYKQIAVLTSMDSLNTIYPYY